MIPGFRFVAASKAIKNPDSPKTARKTKFLPLVYYILSVMIINKESMD